MNERNGFLTEVTRMLNRYGWAKKWPDIQGVEAGIWDIIFDCPVIVGRDDNEWCASINDVIECKADRGELRIPFDAISDVQRKWITWRREHNPGLIGWIAIVMGIRRGHAEHPIRAWLVPWDAWLVVEEATEAKSLSYVSALIELAPYQLFPYKEGEQWEWSIPSHHEFAQYFRLEENEPNQPTLI